MTETSYEQQESASSKAARRFSEIPREELERLLSLRHHDPHSILGTHPVAGGVVVRAYRPGADRVRLLIEGEKPLSMAPRPEDEGLFEVLVQNRREVFPYRVEVSYPGDVVYTMRLPYSFAPTLSELDLYLLGEQKHERSYDKMGAHVREIDGRLMRLGSAWWGTSIPGMAGCT
jgi:1,4-alpha-glucan branching enzyme